MRRSILTLLLTVAVLLKVAAQEALDDVFDNPPTDIEAHSTQKPDLSSLDTSPASVTGALSSDLGIATGLQSDDAGLSPGISGYYAMKGSLTFDSRPDPSIRLHASLGTSLVNNSFSIPSFNELFLDYTLYSSVFFRVGKQVLSWGQGRLFNPGNLMTNSPNVFTLKGFVPLLGQSLTTVVLADTSKFKTQTDPSWREMTYAFQLTGDLGPIGYGVAGKVWPGLDLQGTDRTGTAFLKTTLFGIDLFAEGILNLQEYHYLVGAFWEGGTPKIRLDAEVTDTRLGVATKILDWSWKPAIRWEQSLIDGSGTVTAGLEGTLLPHLTLVWGGAWVYGLSGQEYVLSNPDPGKRRWITGVKLTLQSNF